MAFCLAKITNHLKKNEIDSILENLKFTLSFSQGRFIEINYLKGIVSDKLKFQFIKHSKAWPTKSRVTWFDDDNSESLFDVYRCITNIRKKEAWNPELLKIFCWYFESLNDLALETSIILNQATLELLVWVYFVEDVKEYSKNKFMDMSFNERLDLFVGKILEEEHYIKYLPALEKFNKKDKKDKKGLISSFVQIRNFIIHPDKKQRLEWSDHNLKYDTQKLGFFLIEMFILFIIDFKGKAHNSLNRPFVSGKSVSVPWINENGEIKELSI